jgi:pSer/pThr/pTyr-binding forkhead associated (FHA) protein
VAAPDTESVWLEQGSQRFPLSEGTSVVGRAAGSDVHLNDDLVSRRHAEFKVDGLAVRVVDLASANGVYVNSRRIQSEAVLKDGDIVTIGRCQLRVRASGPSGVGAVMSLRRTLTQVSDSDISQSGDGDTRTGTVFDLLGPVADKALRLGRVVEAERILGPALQTLLASIRPDRGVLREAVERAAGYALRLADTTNRPEWIDYTLELHAKSGRPPSVDLIDDLHRLVRRIPGVSVPKLRMAIDTLREKSQGLGPNERFALQRLEGLERVIIG